MSLNEISQLAQALADQNREINDTKTNISPDDLNATLPLFAFERPIKITGQITLTAYSYPTNGFVANHPVYGILNSTVHLLDQGYAPGSTVLHETEF